MIGAEDDPILTQADGGVSITRNGVVAVNVRVSERAQRLCAAETAVESLSIGSVGVDEGGTGVDDTSSGSNDLLASHGGGVLGDGPVCLLRHRGVGDGTSVLGGIGPAQVELGSALRKGE